MADVGLKRLVANLIELDADPARGADVRRPVIRVRCLFDERLLQPRRRWEHYGHVPVTVMVVREPGEDALMDEERRLPVRQLLRRAWQRQTDSPHTPKLTRERLRRHR